MDRLRWRLVLTVAVVAVVASGCTFVARVSVGTNGVQGNAESNHPALDGDGRYVAFSSVAGDLVAGDSNAREDVFVRDNVTHVVERVSVSTDGTEANGGSSNPAISAMAGTSRSTPLATNLVASAWRSAEQRVRPRPPDRRDAHSSHRAGGTRPDISATGRYVAFIPLPVGQVVALFDRDTATVENFGAESSGTVSELSISDDANRVLVTKLEGFDPGTGFPNIRGRVYDPRGGHNNRARPTDRAFRQVVGRRPLCRVHLGAVYGHAGQSESVAVPLDVAEPRRTRRRCDLVRTGLRRRHGDLPRRPVRRVRHERRAVFPTTRTAQPTCTSGTGSRRGRSSPAPTRSAGRRSRAARGWRRSPVTAGTWGSRRGRGTRPATRTEWATCSSAPSPHPSPSPRSRPARRAAPARRSPSPALRLRPTPPCCSKARGSRRSERRGSRTPNCRVAITVAADAPVGSA